MGNVTLHPTCPHGRRNWLKGLYFDRINLERSSQVGFYKKQLIQLLMTQPKSKFLQLFERDQGRCVYCGLDLKADYDRFMMATEDHLLPGSKGSYARELGNLVLSCRTCNSLKGNFVPDPPIDLKKQRRQYITAVRAHVMAKRAERLKDFLKVTHPGMLDYL
jgi:CRISPR/Cas system Type II protein with McrA/HNH and RuvC-like nuclease domain